MKNHPILVGFSVLLLAICGAVVVPVIWERSHTLYTTPETESAFLKSYTPKGVIEQFQCRESSSHAQHRGGEAGREFVTHMAGFQWFFVMRPEKWMPLMNALRDDVSAQLVGNRAQILSQSGDPRSGFHFDYKLGNSIGTLTILPLDTDSHVQRRMPLPDGTMDVTARIEQTENWFPKEPGMITVKFNTNIR